MKIAQEPQVLDKNKKENLKNEKGKYRNQPKGNFLESPTYNINVERIGEVRSINIQEKKCIKSFQSYSDLLQDLRNTKKDSKYKSSEMTNVQVVPYEIPAAYSLEIEEETLCQIKKRLEIIKQSMPITDVESISLDWKQIGGDINNALCRYRRRFVEKNK